MKFNKKVQHAIEELTKDVSSLFPKLPNPRWIAMRLLEGDERIIKAIENGAPREEIITIPNAFYDPDL